MARPTLATIISRAHKLATIPEQSSGRTDALSSQAETIAEVNSALGELHELIVDAYQDYLTVYTELSMTAGSNSTQLPDDFFKLRSLHVVIDSDHRQKLDPWQMSDRGSYRVNESWDYPNYRIIGNDIIWMPTPNTTRTVEMYYIRQFQPLENTTDELPQEIPLGWEDFLVAHVAEWLLDIAELDPTPGVRRLQKARKRITESAGKRNSAEPQTTTDVNNRYGYNRRNRYGWPRR